MPNNTEIIVIAAVTPSGAIGRKGQLLFHISADLRRFKQLTLGHPIVMGRKTFESFPKGALPGRRNIVVTRNAAFDAPGAECYGSLDDALAAAAQSDNRIFVIGGGSLYAEAIGMADTLELTMIDREPDGDEPDTFFPAINDAEWTRVWQSRPEKDPGTDASYRFVRFIR